MGGWKERSTIDTVTTLVHMIQKKWQEKKIAVVLFIDIKRVFDHVSKNQLFRQIIKLGINSDLVN